MAAVFTLAVAVLLPGCASVPDDGPPVAMPNRKLEEAGNPDVNAEIAAPRVLGGPLDTVTLMLEAARSTQNRDQLGETFMTQNAQEAWKQRTDVLIFRPRDTKVQREDKNTATVVLRGTVVATINVNGSYQPQAWRDETIPFKLVKRDVWLLDTPPPGVLVREADFAQAFQQVTLYFAALSNRDPGDVLIPEVRWQDRSVSRDAIITPIVKLLLRRASSWLAPATRNPPNSTSLRGNVTQQGSDLVLDLSPEIEVATPEDINSFAAEVAWSLRSQLVGALRLEVNGRPLNVTGVQPVQGSDQWNNYNPFTRSGTTLFYLNNGHLNALPEPNDSDADPSQLGGKAAQGGVLSAGISLSQRRLALVKAVPGGQGLWVGPMTGEMVAMRATAKTITRPTWGGSDDQVLVALDGKPAFVAADGSVTMVTFPQSSSIGAVRAMRISPDGARVVLAAGAENNTRAYLGMIQRSPDGSQPTLMNVTPVRAPQAKQRDTPLMAKVTDVGWAGPTTVAIAGQATDNTAIVRKISTDFAIEEPTVSTGLRAGAVSIAVTPTVGAPQAEYAESGKQLYQNGPRSWGVVAELDNVQAPFFPG
jgi:hypothetical protein